MGKKTTVRNKIIGDNLIKSEAKKLRDWWNANTAPYYFMRKMDNGKYWEVYEQKPDFETGATSAAVNELILYTDNTRELSELRDEIYEKNEPRFTLLLIKALGRYRREFGHDVDRENWLLTSDQKEEYIQIYANRFEEWKKERERNDKQK